MKNKTAFKVGQKVVTIEMKTSSKLKGWFALSGSIYELHVSDKHEIREEQHELITDNLDLFVKDLENESISDLVEDQVYDIFAGYTTSDDNIAQFLGDDELIGVHFVSGGQNYNEILGLLPDNEDIKQLVKLWKTYQLQDNVDQLIVDKVTNILDKLDSGKDEYDLAEGILDAYML